MKYKNENKLGCIVKYSKVYLKDIIRHVIKDFKKLYLIYLMLL